MKVAIYACYRRNSRNSCSTKRAAVAVAQMLGPRRKVSKCVCTRRCSTVSGWRGWYDRDDAGTSSRSGLHASGTDLLRRTFVSAAADYTSVDHQTSRRGAYAAIAQPVSRRSPPVSTEGGQRRGPKAARRRPSVWRGVVNGGSPVGSITAHAECEVDEPATNDSGTGCEPRNHNTTRVVGVSHRVPPFVPRAVASTLLVSMTSRHRHP